MTDTILKQNAGMGGAVVVSGTTQTVPAGEYSSMVVIAALTANALVTPKLTGTLPAAIPALFRLDTLITGGTISGTAIFYKALSA